MYQLKPINNAGEKKSNRVVVNRDSNESFNIVDVIRTNILSKLKKDLKKLKSGPDKRFEGLTNKVELKVDKDLVYGMLKSFPKTMNLERETFDYIWDKIGGVDLEIQTPKAFFEKDFFEVGFIRRGKFADEYGWKFDLNLGMDLSIQDLFSYFGVAKTKYGIIGCYRDPYSSIPRKDTSFFDILASQENIAFQELRKSNAPGFENYDLIEEILVSPKYNEIIEAAKKGLLGSIERFTTLSKQDYIDSFPEELVPYRHIINTIGMLLIFATLTACSLRNERRYSIIQTAEDFLILLKILLGENKGIFHISTSVQKKADKNGNLIDDNCITSLLDFEGCMENCRVYLPELYEATKEFHTQLKQSSATMMIDKITENDRMKFEQ